MRVRSVFTATIVLWALIRGAAGAEPEPAVVSRTTASGLRIVACHDPEAPVAAIRVLVRAGVADEGRSPGIARVTAWALLGANESQSRESVAREIDAIGGSVTVDIGPDYTAIGCNTTAQAFEHAAWVLGLALRGAEFDSRSLQEARSAALEVARRERSDAYEAAYLAVRQALHDASPYRLPFGGDPVVISSLPRDAVVAFHRSHYVPANVVVAVYGCVPVQRCMESVERSFGDLRGRPAPRPRWLPGADSRRAYEPPRSEIIVTGKSALIALGVRAPAVSSPDYAAFALASAILGQGKASRLYRRTREALGIGYSVGALYPALEGEGHMMAHIEVSSGRPPEDLARAERVLVEAVRSMTAAPPSEAEVERARRLLSGQWLVGRQRAAERALQMARALFYGVGSKMDEDLPAALRAVTVQDVERVARRYLSRHVIVVARPASPSP